MVYGEDIVVTTGQGYSLLIKSQWKRTLDRQEIGGEILDLSMSAPVMSIDIEG